MKEVLKKIMTELQMDRDSILNVTKIDPHLWDAVLDGKFPALFPNDVHTIMEELNLPRIYEILLSKHMISTKDLLKEYIEKCNRQDLLKFLILIEESMKYEF